MILLSTRIHSSLIPLSLVSIFINNKYFSLNYVIIQANNKYYIFIKTANFNILKKNEVYGAISISLFPSKFNDVKFEYKALAPNYKILDNLKNKKINQEKFIQLYKEQLSELNPKNVFEHLIILTGGFEPVLMCHCAKTKFCHRHLVADWLEKHLEVDIKEFKQPNYKRSRGYLIKITPPSLFIEEEINT